MKWTAIWIRTTHWTVMRIPKICRNWPFMWVYHQRKEQYPISSYCNWLTPPHQQQMLEWGMSVCLASQWTNGNFAMSVNLAIVINNSIIIGYPFLKFAARHFRQQILLLAFSYCLQKMLKWKSLILQRGQLLCLACVIFRVNKLVKRAETNRDNV